jgi:hypothetical protein
MRNLEALVRSGEDTCRQQQEQLNEYRQQAARWYEQSQKLQTKIDEVSMKGNWRRPDDALLLGGMWG